MSDERRLEDIYRNYAEQLAQARAQEKPADGLLGFGGGIKSAPCHDAFAQALKEYLARFCGEEPTPEQAQAAIRYAIEAPRNCGDEAGRWMLAAVAGFFVPLAARLAPKQAEELAQLYEAAVPRTERLPSQRELLDALKKQQGRCEKRFGWHSFRGKR